MNKRLLLGVLVLLVHPRLSLSNELEADRPASGYANTVSIEVREKHPPRVFVNVDGMEVPLQFDLGDSTALVLQKSVLESIKAAPTGESVKLQGVDGFFEAPLFKVKRVQIGTAVFTDVAARLDIARQGYEPHPRERGFLGTGLLKPYQLVINYPQHTMSLVSRSLTSASSACQGTSVPFLPQFGGEPVTKVDTDRAIQRRESVSVGAGAMADAFARALQRS